MKKARLILTTSMFALMGFSAITLSSCTKDDKTCEVGYEGSDCKTLSREKFIGSWEGDENCTIGTDNYTITIAAGSNSDLAIVYTNVYNDPSNYVAKGTMTGTNGFSFSGTASGGVSFSGTATYDAGTGRLTVDYKVMTGSVETNSCTFVGTKL